MLLRILLQLLDGWRPAFRQDRSRRRAAAQALGTLVSFGRRTLSRAIWALGRQQQDWSAEYRLHSRSDWNPALLFQPVLEKALPFCGGRYVAAAIDDTRIHKTGRRIQSAFYQRDPLSPKFRFNLMFGLRFLQISLLVPLYRRHQASPRALPVRFEEVPALKHPRRKAPSEQWAAYRRAVKQNNLSTHAVTTITGLRSSLDAAGQKTKRLLMVGDGSLCLWYLLAVRRTTASLAVVCGCADSLSGAGSQTEILSGPGLLAHHRPPRHAARAVAGLLRPLAD